MCGSVLKLVKEINILVERNSKECENKIFELFNHISNQLTTSEYSMPIASRNELLMCITLINPTRFLMLEKCASLISLLCIPKTINIEVALFERILMWLENSLKMTKDKEENVSTKILCAIRAMFETHQHYISVYLESILHPQNSLLLHYLDDILIREDQCTNSEKELEIIIDILNLFLHDEVMINPNVETIIKVVGDYVLRLYFSTNASQCARNLTFLPVTIFPLLSKISKLCPEYAELHIAEFLGLVKAYMHYDKEYKAHQINKLQMSPQSLYNLLEQTAELNVEPTGKKISKTSKVKIPTKNQKSLDFTTGSSLTICNYYISSNSLHDTTDLHHLHCETECFCNDCVFKIRISALLLMEVLVNSLQVNIFYGYWYVFFPHNSDCKQGLLHSAFNDSNASCRALALKIATQMIYSAKNFLEQAETNRKSPTSYLPFSSSLGQIIHTMYETLSQAIAAENSVTVLGNILKCLAVLVESTSFHRMHCDLVYSFINPVRNLIYSADDSIQFSALMIMELFISSPKINGKILKCLENPIETKTIPNQFGEDNFDSVDERNMVQRENWLLNAVLEKLTQREIAASIKIKSLQVLTSMSIHFSMLLAKLDDIAVVLKRAILDNLPDVRLYASKCLDSIAYNMSNYLHGKETDELLPFKHFCLYMLPTAIDKIRENAQANSFKVCLCDFLSNLGCIVFNLLPSPIQTNLLSSLTGFAGDVQEDAMVRAASVRALAVYMHLPSFKKNLVFVENVAALAIPLAKDPNVNVRIKSIWSISNVTDALVRNCESTSSERISNTMLNSLIEVSIDSCNDSDKVRCSSVRALGNLYSLLTEEMLVDIRYRKIFQKGVTKLIDCIKASGNAKVKWNSCYAIGCFMKNTVVFKAICIYDNFTWHTSVFSVLCNVIVGHSNFKVRINATNALANISERSFFGVNFGLCWDSLLVALEKSCNLSNYLEYNHRDKLQECLCIALCNFICKASDNDYLLMRKELVGREEIIKVIWFRVINRMTPESAAPLLSSSTLLKTRTLLKNGFTVEQKKAIDYIAETFSFLK